MAKHRIEWEDVDGKSHEDMYDTDFLTLAEAREIKKWTGLNPVQWINDQNDPDNRAAMVCILRRRAGEDKLRETEVDFNYQSYVITFIPDEDGEPDPPVAVSSA